MHCPAWDDAFVSSFTLVVSTCQVIGWKDPSEDTLTWCGDYLHKAQVEESVDVLKFLSTSISFSVWTPLSM